MSRYLQPFFGNKVLLSQIIRTLDCYVAVTGLPEPQDDHAVIMAKFAAQCLLQIGPVLHSLVDKLGPDTAELSICFGLNSGPVTAGVLRGEKARFQLFGDTVNTATRMETTGQSGRIHVLESTAGLLQGAGYQSWVEARTSLVEAKVHTSLCMLRRKKLVLGSETKLALLSHFAC